MSSPAGTAFRNPGQIVTFASSLTHATAPDGTLVILDATLQNGVKLPGGASPVPASAAMVGLVYNGNHPTADNAPVDVVINGIYPGIAGATITAGQYLTSNGTDGTVAPAAPAGGTNCVVIGWALSDAASGERVGIQIAPSVLQG